MEVDVLMQCPAKNQFFPKRLGCRPEFRTFFAKQDDLNGLKITNDESLLPSLNNAFQNTIYKTTI